MYLRGITILPWEDSVLEKGRKKLIKGQCPLRDIATAWDLVSDSETRRNLERSLPELQLSTSRVLILITQDHHMDGLSNEEDL